MMKNLSSSSVPYIRVTPSAMQGRTESEAILRSLTETSLKNPRRARLAKDAAAESSTSSPPRVAGSVSVSKDSVASCRKGRGLAYASHPWATCSSLVPPSRRGERKPIGRLRGESTKGSSVGALCHRVPQETIFSCHGDEMVYVSQASVDDNLESLLATPQRVLYLSASPPGTIHPRAARSRRPSRGTTAARCRPVVLYVCRLPARPTTRGCRIHLQDRLVTRGRPRFDEPDTSCDFASHCGLRMSTLCPGRFPGPPASSPLPREFPPSLSHTRLNPFPIRDGCSPHRALAVSLLLSSSPPRACRPKLSPSVWL